MALANGLLLADVFHKRFAPKTHQLGYKVFYLCFPLSQLTHIQSRLLSLSGFNLFGYREKDHGFGDAGNEAWARSVLAQENITAADGEIVLLTMPRVLGYGFNPVSFWFCLDKAGDVRAVISEVNNTFGERHAYVSAHEDHRPITRDDMLDSHKVFHVSPYFKVEGHYRFRFAYSEQKIGVWIDYYHGEQKMLTTSLTGKRHELSDRLLLFYFIRYPMVTLKVIALIHYHALRLVLKGIRYHRKPVKTSKDVSR